MIFWQVLGVLLALLFLRDGLRVRARWSAVPTLPAASSPEEGGYELLLHPGASLTAEGQSAAAAYARAQGLDVLDLVPAEWTALRALGFAQGVDPARYAADRVAQGWTAGQGVLVAKELRARAGLASRTPTDAVDLLKMVRVLKQYAPLSCGFAVAPGLKAARLSPAERFGVLREMFQLFTPSVLAGQMTLFVLTAMAAWRGGWLGPVGLVGFHLQTLLALSSAPVEIPDRLPAALFAWPLQVWEWITAVSAAAPDADRASRVRALRPTYEAELASGVDRLLEPRVDACYLCGGKRLAVEVSVPDLIQHKPGHFAMERCLDCGHLFQNPRLSLAGLDFYYRDFYDGLGGAWLETVFGLSQREYQARAKALDGQTPRRWIDVGGGYGHFCNAAREVWPDTRFECLDMGSSVEEAVRRGWADAGHRGLLPELAPTLAGQFDVVSMSHCLEHTRDPRAEIAGARTVLAPGGTLIIDVPNPDSGLRKLLRSRWLPYFQPQHQHMLSVANMKKLVEEAGLQVVRVDYQDAHTSQDFLFGVFLTLDAWAPQDVPWRPASAGASEWRRAVVWGAGMPALLLAAIADGVVRKLASAPTIANGFRLLAKKTGSPEISGAKGD